MKDLVTEKWVEGVSPDDRVSDVAVRSVQGRLDAVVYYLRLAAEKAEEDVEYVHQLRVWTRRATAALELYADLMPRRRLRRLEKQLRHVRRAANDARDCDVLIQRLKKKRRSPTQERWLESVHAERAQAQAAVIVAHERLSGDRCFTRRLDKLLRRLWSRAEKRVGPRVPFADWAHEHLRSALKRFFAAVPADHTDQAALHRFRIRGKELRYVMELLAGAFPESFRTQLYPIVEEIQDRLGEINDLATAIARLRKKIKEASESPDLASWRQLLVKEQAQLGQACEAFWKWRSARRLRELCVRFRTALAAWPEQGDQAVPARMQRIY